MTLKTNSRIAGVAFLFYIVIGIASMVLFGQVTRGAEGTAAKLASIAGHETTVRLTVVLTLLMFVCAVTLAVTLRALTREEDRDLAVLALCFRLSEGVIGAVGAVSTLVLISVATASASAAGAEGAATIALGGLLLKAEGSFSNVSATAFAIGSALYAMLFLRARSIPAALAWLGVLASLLLVVALPLQLAGFLSGPVTSFIWLPMLLFEVPLALWLLVKGVKEPAATTR